MDKENQISVKILSVGDSQTGKSCLIKRYCEERFVSRYITTIGVDYGVKKLNIKNRKIAVNFFDLSGNEEYKTIRNDFYKDAQGVILVFDLTDKDTYQNILKWDKEMRLHGVDSKATVFLIGNKSDLRNREVENPDAIKLAKSKGWEYYQTSANNGENVKDVFEKLLKRVYDNIEAEMSMYN